MSVCALLSPVDALTDVEEFAADAGVVVCAGHFLPHNHDRPLFEQTTVTETTVVPSMPDLVLRILARLPAPVAYQIMAYAPRMPRRTVEQQLSPALSPFRTHAHLLQTVADGVEMQSGRVWPVCTVELPRHRHLGTLQAARRR